MIEREHLNLQAVHTIITDTGAVDADIAPFQSLGIEVIRA